MFTAVGPSVFSVFADTVAVYAFSRGSARFPALYRCWAAVWPFFFFIPFADAATILTTRLTLAITRAIFVLVADHWVLVLVTVGQVATVSAPVHKFGNWNSHIFIIVLLQNPKSTAP